MTYFKSGVAVLLALGIAAPAAYAQPAQKGSAQSRATNLSKTINYNSTTANVSGYNWSKRVTLSGLVNLDGVYASRGFIANDAAPSLTGVVPSFSTSTHATSISVGNINLLLDARINRYTSAHVGLVRLDEQSGDNAFFGNGINVDEAYVTMSNFTKLPFYLRAGRMYTAFGDYTNPYPVTKSFTQLLSATVANTVQLGYASGKLSGVVYVSKGVVSSPFEESADAFATRLRNFGAKVGYKDSYRGFKYAVDASFMHDIRDAMYLTNVITSDAATVNSRRAAGAALHVGVKSGAWDFNSEYVSALRALVANTADTRPWAYSLDLGYRFKAMNYANRFAVTYERSGQPAFFNEVTGQTVGSMLPRYRVGANWNVNLGRNTDLTFQYQHARDFGVDSNNSNVAKVRLGVRF